MKFGGSSNLRNIEILTSNFFPYKSSYHFKYLNCILRLQTSNLAVLLSFSCSFHFCYSFLVPGWVGHVTRSCKEPIVGFYPLCCVIKQKDPLSPGICLSFQLFGPKTVEMQSIGPLQPHKPKQVEVETVVPNRT